MRIVGGRFKGRSIVMPHNHNATRPTTDRLRESLASMILSACDLNITDKHLLDMFAGSGAVSFELLSRGLKRAVMIEQDAKARAALKATAQDLKLIHTEYKLYPGKVGEVLHRLDGEGAFHLVFCDPPYAMPADEVQTYLEQLRSYGILAPDALIVYEHHTQSEGLSWQLLELIKSKKQADTTLDLYRYQG